MDHDEQREGAQEQPQKGDGQGEDPQRFEKIGREVRKAQSPNVGEEGTSSTAIGAPAP